MKISTEYFSKNICFDSNIFSIEFEDKIFTVKDEKDKDLPDYPKTLSHVLVAPLKKSE